MKIRLLKRVEALVNELASVDGWTIRNNEVVGVRVSYNKGYKYLADLRRDFLLHTDGKSIEKNIDDSLHLAVQEYWKKEGRGYWREKMGKD
ncbi:hypothetical protein [Porphyromonas gingivicanis]|uniref:hypothetical protein n=1 Tax=Porphyromonas gingivicanis TaxID=266762 RepID=UPI000471BFB5|nr:hypothetical protein [Porphyromonas gingivicanis]